MIDYYQVRLEQQRNKLRSDLSKSERHNAILAVVCAGLSILLLLVLL